MSESASSIFSAADKIPVTVLTGFLGAGKTTLLNNILTRTHGKKFAVIENEYGEVGIDDALVKRRIDAEEEIFEMNNGCICCTVRGDLMRIMGKLLARDGESQLDGILIETTGMADPAPVAQTFFVDEEIKAKARLDGIITVVDAKHIVQHLDEPRAGGAENEAREQVAFADKMLLNKVDLVSAEELAEAKQRIRALNPGAHIVECTRAEVDPGELLNIRAFDLDRVLAIEPGFLEIESEHGAHDHDHSHEHGHHHEDNGIGGDAGAVDDAGAGSGHDQGHSHHHHKHKQKHTHDSAISSVGIVEKGELDMAKVNGWLGALLRDKGQDIYRMKGVLAIRDAPAKFVFHAVHMQFDGTPHEPWAEGEERISKLIFIGKNLDRDALNEAFRACLV